MACQSIQVLYCPMRSTVSAWSDDFSNTKKEEEISQFGLTKTDVQGPRAVVKSSSLKTTVSNNIAHSIILFKNPRFMCPKNV